MPKSATVAAIYGSSRVSPRRRRFNRAPPPPRPPAAPNPSPPRAGSREQTRGTYEQHHEQERVNDGVGDLVGKLSLEQFLNDPDEQAAQHASDRRLQTADDRTDETLDGNGNAAGAADQGDRSDDRSGERGESDRDCDRERAGAVDVDSDQSRTDRVIRSGANRFTVGRAFEEEPEQRKDEHQQDHHRDLLGRDMNAENLPGYVRRATAEEGKRFRQAAPDQRMSV